MSPLWNLAMAITKKINCHQESKTYIHKIMKHFFIPLIAVLLFFVACKQKNDSMTEKADVELHPCSVINEMDDMVVYTITDRISSMSIDLFKGSYDDSLLSQLMPEGESRSAINVFFIKTTGYYGGGKHNILIDAGLGEDAGGMMLQQLHKLGVKTEEIDAVCLTHLHGDHIGGLLKEGKPVFPNADVYLSVDEFNAWSDDGPMASRNDQWKQVLSVYSNRIKLCNNGDTIVDGWVVAHLAPGHTPGHTMYESGLCLFIGDLVHAQDIQYAYPEFCARYDNNPAQAVETRKRVLSTMEGRYLCGAHCYEQQMLTQ